MQCDTLEFLLALFKNIKLEIENSALLNEFIKTFEGKTKGTLRCRCGSSKISRFLRLREEQFTFLNVRLEFINSKGSMDRTLKNYFNSFIANKTCDECSSLITNEIRISEYPKYLIIQLQNHSSSPIEDIYEINLEKFFLDQLRNDFYSIKGFFIIFFLL